MKGPFARLFGRTEDPAEPPASGDPSAEPTATNPHRALDRPLQILLWLQYRQAAAAGSTAFSPLCFDDVGFDVFSSTNEDGILLYIFALIGFETRRCVDIGAGGIRGSNVANLILHHGFEALLIDGDAPALAEAAAFYGRHHQASIFPPTTLSTRVTRDNVNDVLTQHEMAGPIDLLCLDIDGIDYWIWRAIEASEPRVVVVGYQDILGPDRAWTVPYQPDFDVTAHTVNRDHYNYSGASLRAFTKLAEQKAYRLVGCNRGGWNAFFVKRGVGDELLPEVSVESCFRYRWNEYGMTERFALVENLDWEEV